jgi:hypothetical protein
MGKFPNQADHTNLSSAVDDEHDCTPPTSRSSSCGVDSASAEYREWPFQGFLKLITIGDQTIYNLDFALPAIPEHPLYSKILGTGCKGSSAKAAESHYAVMPRKVGKELTKEQERHLAKLIDNKTWTEIGRCFPGHSLQSLKENFFTKQRGQPRKRGVRVRCI